MAVNKAVVGKSTYSEVSTGLLPKQVAFLKTKLFTYYDHLSEVLHIAWKGSVSSEEIKEGYRYVLELVAVFKPTRWLLDLRERELIARNDQRWVFKNIFPEVLRVVQQNVFIGIILPVDSYQSVINSLDGDELMYEDNFIIFNEFLYAAEAKRWLEAECH